MPRARPKTLDEFIRGWPIRRLECGCLKWIGGKSGRHYGRLLLDDGYHYAHRLAHELEHGKPLPPGVLLNRRTEVCDEPLCILPAHWAKGTRATVPKMNARRKLTRRGVLQSVAVAVGRRKRAKLTIEKVREIRARRDERADALAAEYGVDRSMIYYIWRGDHWAEATPMGGGLGVRS